MIDFMQNLQTEEHDFQETFVNAAHSTDALPGDIPSSKEISGIDIRLTNVTIIDNKTPKVFPFPGLAMVYLINLIVTDLDVAPISIDLKGFEKVADNYKLNIDRSVFLWKKKNGDAISPSQIHVFSSIVKSKQPLRDVAKVMADINNDSNFTGLVADLAQLLKTASNITNISGLIFQVANIAGGFLGKVDDKPLLTWVQSFTDIYGDFDPLGETIKSARNKYASMDLSVTIRDAGRS